jgi:hypothetical protein
MILGGVILEIFLKMSLPFVGGKICPSNILSSLL